MKNVCVPREFPAWNEWERRVRSVQWRMCTEVFAWITMRDFLLCFCNSIYIFWKSLPVHLNASDNPVFETCNFFVCIIYATPAEGRRHFAAWNYGSVFWPSFSCIRQSSSCYTQKNPPIICQPPTKLHGVTQHNTVIPRLTKIILSGITFVGRNLR